MYQHCQLILTQEKWFWTCDFQKYKIINLWFSLSQQFFSNTQIYFSIRFGTEWFLIHQIFGSCRICSLETEFLTILWNTLLHSSINSNLSLLVCFSSFILSTALWKNFQHSFNFILFYFLSVYFWTIPEVIRTCTWLCTQQALLMGLKGPYGVLGIIPRLTKCKAALYTLYYHSGCFVFISILSAQNNQN